MKTAPQAVVVATRVRFWLPALWLGLATIGAYGAVLYAFGVLLEPIREATGWGAGQLATAYSLCMLSGGAFGLVVGRVLDARGSRPVFIASLGLGVPLLIAASWAREPWQFVSAWALGGGAVAGGLYYHATMAAVARLYPGRRSQAIAALTLIGALAGPIFYPLTGWLLESLSWSATVRVLVGLMTLCALPAALLVQTAAPAPDQTGEAAARTADWTAVRNLPVLLFLTAVAFAAAAATALTLYQVPAMQAASGMSLATVATVSGLRGLFQFAGRAALVPLTSRAGVPGALGVCYLATAGGVALLLLPGAMAVLVAFVAVTGVTIGLLAPLHGLMATDTYREERLATFLAAQHVIGSVGGAGGAWFGGVVLDATDSYAAIVIMIVVLQLGALVSLTVQRRSAPGVRGGPEQTCYPAG